MLECSIHRFIRNYVSHVGAVNAPTTNMLMVWMSMVGSSLAIVLLCTSSGNRYLPEDGDEGGAEVLLHLVLQSTHPSVQRRKIESKNIRIANNSVESSALFSISSWSTVHRYPGSRLKSTFHSLNRRYYSCPGSTPPHTPESSVRGGSQDRQ